MKRIAHILRNFFLPFKRRVGGVFFLLLFALTACTVSYKFNGASIDYTKTKTIQIDNFPIRSAYVWAPMQSIFQNKLTDLYASQTKLKQVMSTSHRIAAMNPGQPMLMR